MTIKTNAIEIQLQPEELRHLQIDNMDKVIDMIKRVTTVTPINPIGFKPKSKEENENTNHPS